MKRALVTGADGFVGQWLLRALIDAGVRVTGLVRNPRSDLTTLDEPYAKQVDWRHFDLLELETVRTALKGETPDAIFHLAAQSSVPDSFTHPIETLEINVTGTVNLLQAARQECSSATVIVVGSSDAYGAQPAEVVPLKEDLPLNPGNPYAASKAAAEIVALQYARSRWLNVIPTRSFNHSGPGQSTKFAIASFAKQVADVKTNRKPPHVRVGNLSPRRDFTDVRDIVAAYVLLAERGRSGTVYNVCSGADHSMQEILETLIELADVSVDVVQDSTLLRPVDAPRLLGDPRRIHEDTGWRPQIEFRQMLADLLDYYATA